MKTEEPKEKLIKISESGLVSLVANMLKDKVLFADKVQSAKEYLKKVKVSAL